MQNLVLALYCEGSTDERCLPIIIQRTAEQILRRRQVKIGSLYEPLARQIDLSKLEAVPAYQTFVEALSSMFAEYGLV